MLATDVFMMQQDPFKDLEFSGDYDSYHQLSAVALPILTVSEFVVWGSWAVNTLVDNQGGSFHAIFNTVNSVSRLFAYVLNPAFAVSLLAGWSDLDLGAESSVYIIAAFANMYLTSLWYPNLSRAYLNTQGSEMMEMGG